MALSTAKFHQHFWGEDNVGFEVLLQNMKAGFSASKELGEYVRERMVVEDGYVKGLSKLQKTVNHVPAASVGSFGPLWEVLRAMCEKLVSVHSQFVKVLAELGREINEYHHTHKEKLKGNTRGEIEGTQESLNAYQATESAVYRCKKQYQHYASTLAKVQGKAERARAESPSNPKIITLDSRVRQEQSLMEATQVEYKTSVAKHCNLVMDYQGKMSEACVKFESLEEEHLAQMFTFMIKIARTHGTMHVGEAELFSTLNSQLDVLTVEKLLKMFVEDKGTGITKPTPLKFKPIPVVVSTNSSLSASMEDITADRRNSKATTTENKLRKIFKKKAAKSQAESEQNQVHIPENAPEVDEEGYSIRPEDAANFSRFPDDAPKKRSASDSDSDFDDEPENKIRNIVIRESSTQPVASVDDIKASVMSLRLGAISPQGGISPQGMRKATSSQSLNILGSSTPPNAHHKMSTTNSSHNLKESTTSTTESGVASLIDIDLTSAPHMPAPLLPTALNSKGGTANIPAPLLPTSTSIRGGGSQIPVPLVPSVRVEGHQDNSSPMSFDPKTIDATASLPAWNFQFPSSSSSSPLLPGFPPTTSASTPTAATGASSSPSIPRPRAGSIKSHDLPLGTEKLGPSSMIPAPPIIPTKRQTSGGVNPLITTSAIVTSNSASQISTLLQPAAVNRDFVAMKRADGGGAGSGGSKSSDYNSGGAGSGGSNSLNSSPLFGRTAPQNHNPLSSGSATSLEEEEAPPILSPRGASLLYSPTPHMTSPISPLATSHTSAHAGVSKVMPLAIAIHETCNAIFRGADLSACVVKVTGEVVMSFPASFLPFLGSCEALAFEVAAKEELERILHNQNLLTKLEEGSRYTFDMASLDTHLKKMQEKSSAPFYNIQILKYDVVVKDGSKLPLQLSAFMKCDTSTTNFRLDYTYQPQVFQSKPTLTKVKFSVPIGGGVKNTISKPTGKWSAEAGHMTWTIGDIPPSENPVPIPIHAKFDLTSGPSPVSAAVASFLCEGDTISGLCLDLKTPAYKVSLLKRKCSSGKYIAEPKSTS